MKSLPAPFEIEVISLGEIRMGCPAYALVVATPTGRFEALRDEPIAVGDDNLDGRVELSTCARSLSVLGSFGHFFLDLHAHTVSMYRVEVRGEGDEFSNENPIFGSQRIHLSTFKRHYCLQVPFVPDEEFPEFLQRYKDLRRRQIRDAVNASTLTG